MKQHRPGRGDWLMVAIILCAFALTFFVLFGRMVAEALGGG